VPWCKRRAPFPSLATFPEYRRLRVLAPRQKLYLCNFYRGAMLARLRHLTVVCHTGAIPSGFGSFPIPVTPFLHFIAAIVNGSKPRIVRRNGQWRPWLSESEICCQACDNNDARTKHRGAFHNRRKVHLRPL
jgi:hypothetical protein